MTRPTFDLSLSVLLPLVRETLKSPRATAEKLIAFNFPGSVLWLMLVTIATVSVLLAQLVALVLLPAGETVDAVFLMNPLMMAFVQWGVLVLTVYAVYHIGRIMGGTASFAAVLTLTCWLQFIMICVQVLQTVALLILPGLAEIITLAGVFLFMWLFTVFVATAHGFKNMIAVFGMIIASTLVIVFVLTFVFAVLGISLEVTGGV